MGIYKYPTRTQQIEADGHDAVIPAAREWAEPTGVLRIDREGDRFQLHRDGTEQLESALAELEAWMDDMRNVGKTTYVINEWPDVFELRNTFDTSFSNGIYTAKPRPNGGYIIRGANDVEMGQIAITREGWEAFRGSPLPGSPTVRTRPYPHPQGALDEFLRIDGFLET